MIVLFVMLLILMVPLVVPRYWMVALAGGLYSGLSLFLYWNALTADPTSHPTIVQIVLPSIRDGVIYFLIASLLYGVKRLFVRAQPRAPSNID